MANVDPNAGTGIAISPSPAGPNNSNVGRETPQKYNSPTGVNPNGGVKSTIGEQFNTQYWLKKALIEMAKETYFGQMADVQSMPKHFGKKIVRYHYLPLLDDANINDQGIDAEGKILADELTIEVRIHPSQVASQMATKPTPLPRDGILGNRFPNNAGPVYDDGTYKIFGVGADLPKAQKAVEQQYIMAFGKVDATTGLLVPPTAKTYSAIKTAVEGMGGKVIEGSAVSGSGNMYGSSKDVGYISTKMPLLSETGGRVNRVGFRRVELEGSFEKFGFFDEYTQESLDFDTDSELSMHVNREMLRGANEMTEDALQIDLLNSAGTVRYGGEATSRATIDGTKDHESLITYEDLMRLSIDLDNNRTPKNTKMITGSRMVDTRVIDGARYAYIGSELIPMVMRMTDLFKNQAFIPVVQYAAAGNVARGELGSVGQFRFIVVPEMMHWEGAGKVATPATNAGYRYGTAPGKSTENYNVYPLLVIGSESFTTIGFQTDGKTVKFKITHKKPGKAIANRDDPYGEVGFMSIKWYYGFMVLRPERIALCLSVAEI